MDAGTASQDSTSPRAEDLGRSALGLALLAGLFLTRDYSYLLFHSLAEIISIAISGGVFMVAWNSRHRVRGSFLLLLGCSAVCAGFLDTLHLLAFKGMHVIPAIAGSRPSPQFWIAARAVQSLSLLVALLSIDRRYAPARVMAVLGGSTLLAAFAILEGHFPDFYREGVGTTLGKAVGEYAISGIFLACCLLLYRSRQRFSPRVLRYLLASTVCMALTELAFTSYVNSYGASNSVGHLLKILGYYFLYKAVVETGLIQPMELLFHDLQLEIEERRRAEAESTFLGRFPHQNPFPVLRVNAAGETLYANPASREVLAMPAAAAAAPLPPPLVATSLEALRSGQLQQCELPVNGTTYLFVAAPIPQEQCANLYGLDITERKKAEALREDMERIARHDLKGPLNAIINLPGLLKEEANLTDQQRECLQAIEDSGYRILHMINLSLDLFKIEQGTYQVALKPVDLSQVLRKVWADLQPTAQARRVTLDLTAETGAGASPAPILALGEETLCYSMLSNLIRNAVEASPREGTVHVALDSDQGRRIRIRNQGEVPPEIRERFFDKYVTRGKKHGAGLGTYSAWLMAVIQGGRVELDASEPGHTTVSVWLLDAA